MISGTHCPYVSVYVDVLWWERQRPQRGQWPMLSNFWGSKLESEHQQWDLSLDRGPLPCSLNYHHNLPDQGTGTADHLTLLGSGPKGMKSCRTQGEFSVQLYLHPQGSFVCSLNWAKDEFSLLRRYSLKKLPSDGKGCKLHQFWKEVAS